MTKFTTTTTNTQRTLKKYVNMLRQNADAGTENRRCKYDKGEGEEEVVVIMV
jgi:hypothetical protein